MLNMYDKIKIFKALGNETRFKIFKNILTGGYTCSADESKPTNDLIAQASCVTTIAEQFKFALPTISRHLKEMKDANIITMTKNKNKIYIEPNIATIKEVSECLSKLLQDYEKGIVYKFDNKE